MRAASNSRPSLLASPQAAWRPSEDQLRKLLRRAQSGDRSAEERILLAFTHMLYATASKVYSSDLPQNAGQPSLSDLMQEGTLELLRAIRRFDLTQPQSFAAYASVTIRGAITNHARHCNSSLHMTRSHASAPIPVPRATTSLDAETPAAAAALASLQVDDQTAVIAPITRPVSNHEHFLLKLIYQDGVPVDAITADELAAARLARRAQNAAHRLAAADPNAPHLPPAPKGQMQPVTYALASAYPALVLKQQALLHLAHSARMSDAEIATYLQEDEQKVTIRRERAETRLLELASLQTPPAAGILSRGIASASILRKRAMTHLTEPAAFALTRRLFFAESTAAIAEASGQKFNVTRDLLTAARKQLTIHERRLLLLYRPTCPN